MKTKLFIRFADFCGIEFCAAALCEKAKPNLIKKSRRLESDIQPQV